MPISTIPSPEDRDAEVKASEEIREAETSRGKLLSLKREARRRVSTMTLKPVVSDMEPANNTEPEFSVYTNEGDAPADDDECVTEVSADPSQDERVCEDFGFEEDKADLSQLEGMSREDVSAGVKAILAKARGQAKTLKPKK